MPSFLPLIVFEPVETVFPPNRKESGTVVGSGVGSSVGSGVGVAVGSAVGSGVGVAVGLQPAPVSASRSVPQPAPVSASRSVPQPAFPLDFPLWKQRVLQQVFQ